MVFLKETIMFQSNLSTTRLGGILSLACQASEAPSVYGMTLYFF